MRPPVPLVVLTLALLLSGSAAASEYEALDARVREVLVPRIERRMSELLAARATAALRAAAARRTAPARLAPASRAAARDESSGRPPAPRFTRADRPLRP